ncbi:MAG: PAS domain-containing protein [Patescibacteria group bacterium]|jgi:PAS domain S-box-containing protein
MLFKKENKNRYKLIFELSPEAIVILDKKGTLIDVNNRLYDWLGYKKEEVLGKNLLQLPYLTKIGKAKALKNFTYRMAGKDVAPYELDFISKSGEKKVGLIMARPIKDEAGNNTEDLIMILDVTTNKKINEDLKNKVKELERINKLMINRELKMIELKNKLKSKI